MVEWGMLTLTLLALLSASGPEATPVPPVPSCSCDISELAGPCGYDLDSCLCDDGHGWRTLWLYDEVSGYCEEYRVIVSPTAEAESESEGRDATREPGAARLERGE